MTSDNNSSARPKLKIEQKKEAKIASPTRIILVSVRGKEKREKI
jgi:hypothetical protein